MEDESEITVEWNGNRFRLADNPRDGKFSLVGIKEDIPHYIAKLQEIAPPSDKGVQEVFRYRLYMPVDDATLAVQWDGKEETALYLSALCRMRKYSGAIEYTGKYRITSNGDYQGGIAVRPTDWLIFPPGTQTVDFESDEKFKQKYIKMPMEG